MELLKITSAILVWLITVVGIPLTVFFIKRLFRQYDDKLALVDVEIKEIKDEVGDVKLKVNDACKYQEQINNIWEQIAKHTLWIERHQEWGISQNEKNHLTLQELAINIKRLCEKQGVEYLKQNGN